MERKNINNFTFCVGSGEAEVVRGGEGREGGGEVGSRVQRF